MAVEPPVKPGMAVALGAKVLFRYESIRLTKAEKRKLRRLVAQVPTGASVRSSAVGVVRAKGATKADLRRALKRAKVVSAYLQARGLPGPIVIGNDARTRSTAPGARRVNVTIRYVTTP